MTSLRFSMIVSFAFLWGCSDSPDLALAPAAAPPAVSDGVAASGDDRCTSAAEVEGCPCDADGATRACGVCGTQSCGAVGEFLWWGACVEPASCGGSGEVIPVADMSPSLETGTIGSRDGGVATETQPTPTTPPPPMPSPIPQPSPSPSPPACTGECRPGATRWCDESNFCQWGKSLCGPDGRWGKCVEVNDLPRGCSGPEYDEECCVAAGECCQKYEGDVVGASVGNCSAQVCSSPSH